MIRLTKILNEATSPKDVIKDLDKVKNDLLKKVDALISKKKKLYSDVDIESPMSADEKALNKDIADLLSQVNTLVLQKRDLVKKSVSEAPTKGQLFAGNLKIDGQKVPVEVELIGADDKTKTFTTKLIHFDKKWASKMPKDGILHIPARIFRAPGGGWYKIKTPKAF